MSPRPTSNSSDRADQVRKRRVTRTQTTAERAARNITAPPITVRGAGVGKPVLQRTASHPRRVYTVAVQKTGQAYSLPIPSLHLGWRTLSGTLVAGLIALLIFFLTSDQFKVDKPQIIGASRVSVADIEAVLKLNGTSIFTVDPQMVSANLEKSFPELRGVSVMVSLPKSVAVQFNERQPVLAWKQAEKLSWIDSQGMIFAARGEAPAALITVQSESAPPRYVIVPTPGPSPTPISTPKSGEEAPQPVVELAPERMDLAILNSALLLSGQLPEKAVLIYSAKEGLGWRDPRGWDVYFGKTLDDLEKKISMVQAIITQLGQKGIKPKYVNLEFLHAPYYRLEP
jgi:hypothetical protein